MFYSSEQKRKENLVACLPVFKRNDFCIHEHLLLQPSGIWHLVIWLAGTNISVESADSIYQHENLKYLTDIILTYTYSHVNYNVSQLGTIIYQNFSLKQNFSCPAVLFMCHLSCWCTVTGVIQGLQDLVLKHCQNFLA
jgi:hypothetical protein